MMERCSDILISLGSDFLAAARIASLVVGDQNLTKSTKSSECNRFVQSPNALGSK
tara:strand:- start:377 stop:541 length:165 start_codon:yes stop_codon:yes gene_type:complete